MRPRHVVLLTFSSDGHCPLWSYPYIGTFPTYLLCLPLLRKLPGVYPKFPIWKSLLCVRQPISSPHLVSPLDATLTKTRGRGLRPSTFRHPSCARSGHSQPPAPHSLPTDHGLLSLITLPHRDPPNLPTCKRMVNRLPATLFPPWHANASPTLPRRSPLARRDCSRHSRFAAFHRAASAGRSTLLDRNWFWTR